MTDPKKKIVANKVEKKLYPATILPNGQNIHRKQRRELIEAVCQAWFNIAPAKAKMFMRYLAEITKVEHKRGKTTADKFTVTIRLPADLFTTLKRAFALYYPDEPMFGQSDDDLQLLYEAAPALFPKEARSGRGTGRTRRK